MSGVVYSLNPWRQEKKIKTGSNVRFLNNPDILQSSFRLPGYRKKIYLSEEAAPGLSLKIISSVKTTVRPVESRGK